MASMGVTPIGGLEPAARAAGYVNRASVRPFQPFAPSAPIPPEEEQANALAPKRFGQSEDAGGGPLAGRDDLTEDEQREVKDLKRRDREVRQHEQAHVAAGGPYVRGGAQLEYTTGPDGKRYATGGEVDIDVSKARTPRATIRKMQVVKRAALAPANPSPQDRAVHAAASRTEQEARREQIEQRGEEEGQQTPSIEGSSAAPANTLEPPGATAPPSGNLDPGAQGHQTLDVLV